MAQITLNKPSGGQLTIAPEDGTSTETVTIPSVGVGKVLQMKDYAWGNTTNSTTRDSWVDLYTFQFTPVASNSEFVIHFSSSTMVNTSSNFSGGLSLGLWVNGTFKHLVANTRIRESNSGWVLFVADSPASTVIERVTHTAGTPITLNIQARFTTGSDFSGSWQVNPTTDFAEATWTRVTVMEVAA